MNIQLFFSWCTGAALAILSFCGSWELQASPGMLLGRNEVPGVYLFSGSGHYCLVAHISENAVLGQGRCLQRNAKIGSLGYLYEKEFKVLNIFNEHMAAFTEETIETAGTVAMYDAALLAFNEQELKLGELAELAAAVPVADAGENKVFLLGYGRTSSGDLSLSFLETSLAQVHQDYFVVSIPEQLSIASHLQVDVDWAKPGALVFNIEMKLIGIVSSVHKNVLVKGEVTQGTYAFAKSLRDTSSTALYRRSIRCANKPCVKNFKNSGIDRSKRLASADYVNRENLRCNAHLDFAYDDQNFLQKVRLTGTGQDCIGLETEFDSCENNHCVSSQTCEVLKLSLGGVTLISRGQYYNFGEANYFPKNTPSDSAGSLSLVSRSCFKADLPGDARTACDAQGNKWMWRTIPATWYEAQQFCSEHGYAMPTADQELTQFLENGQILNKIWTSSKVSPEEEVSHPFPVRKVANGANVRTWFNGFVNHAYEIIPLCKCSSSENL